VLADGIGGLAVLASLVDGVPVPAAVTFPRPAPTRRELAVDALGSRLTALARPAAVLRRLRPALAELNPRGVVRPVRTTLNRATGTSRRAAVARADLGLMRATAHAHAATVNDVVLTAVARALRSYLARQDERLDSLVASVMVAGRASAGPALLGNHWRMVNVFVTNLRGPDERQRFAGAVITDLSRSPS